MPYAIIRNSRVSELADPDPNAAVSIGQLFSMALDDHLYPIAFVLGPTSSFWRWYETTTALPFRAREQLYGLPLIQDRMIEDHVVVLCAGFDRAGALVDTAGCYKLAIPQPGLTQVRQ